MGEDGDNASPEMVLVPRTPTPEMLEAAYYAALDEDAAAVWRAMVEAWLQAKSGKSGAESG